MGRLGTAGFTKDFVRQVLLPDWWDDTCGLDPRLVQDVQIRVARFLNTPLATILDDREPLGAPSYPGVRLRHAARLGGSRIEPAVHAGMQIAAAIIRNLTEPKEVRLPPRDPIEWHKSMAIPGDPPDLAGAVADLWKRGIAVAHVRTLPAPKFQGLACIIAGRPVILLGHDHDEPVRLALYLGHEVAHIVNGDCVEGHPVVDVDETSDSPPVLADLLSTPAPAPRARPEMETRADGYAWSWLTRSDPAPELGISRSATPQEVASRASAMQLYHGVDAAALIWAWAGTHDAYATARLALRALNRDAGARKVLRRALLQNLDTDASDTDAALLRCVVDEAS